MIGLWVSCGRCKAKVKSHQEKWEGEVASIEGMRARLEESLEAQQRTIKQLEASRDKDKEELSSLHVKRMLCSLSRWDRLRCWR